MTFYVAQEGSDPEPYEHEWQAERGAGEGDGREHGAAGDVLGGEGVMGSPLKYDHMHGLDGDCRGCDWGRFRRAIEDSWSAETSVDPKWSPTNPSLGQCAVTALLVQDARGGELVRTTIGGASHYFNRLPSGVEIDLTRQQFAEWEPSAFEVRDRSYIMGFEPTVRRYEKLAQAVERRLAGGR